ncbi:NAD-dependent epimerase/dehydratase family protein [Agromyces sp. Marseille-P2726]|uniref:NAD-dependent epimerase/dehydratase family protein n=1 Tax=Agromyces sp. Marseille-P2726 TaxID=2709132 RepID=UPI00156EF1F2|nr:NAD-dependent epimerase/dehydratase family protein [Agromyces sp. Marseille-P2726]
MTLHAVLGSTGVVGRETVTALRNAGQTVRTVSRAAADPERPGAEHRTADLREAGPAMHAVEGADVAYLTVGLPYSTRVWQRDWPRVIRNVIDACTASGTHLVYFDNVYAYGDLHGRPMTESTPIRPSSRKGRIRAGLLQLLADAERDRGLTVTIARSADFYGPGASTSAFNMFAIDPVARGKPPTWLFDAGQPHSMTYTPDIGAALAVLGTDDRAKGRTWHLPTAAPALTGEEYLELATGGGAGRTRTMSMAMMRIGAIFVPAARESLELAYQYMAPYVFDSSAFERTFGLSPTPYAEGIATTLERARHDARLSDAASRR